MANDDDDDFPDRVLRVGDVVKLTGLSEATIWREVKASRFPAPLVIAPRCRGWRLSELLAWLGSRPTTLPP